jgi:hypothetical protein
MLPLLMTGVLGLAVTTHDGPDQAEPVGGIVTDVSGKAHLRLNWCGTRNPSPKPSPPEDNALLPQLPTGMAVLAGLWAALLAATATYLLVVRRTKSAE